MCINQLKLKIILKLITNKKRPSPYLLIRPIKHKSTALIMVCLFRLQVSLVRKLLVALSIRLTIRAWLIMLHCLASRNPRALRPDISAICVSYLNLINSLSKAFYINRKVQFISTCPQLTVSNQIPLKANPSNL